MDSKFFTHSQIFLMHHCMFNERLVELQGRTGKWPAQAFQDLDSQLYLFEQCADGSSKTRLSIDIRIVSSCVAGEIEREKLRLQMGLDDRSDLATVHEYSADLHTLYAKLQRMIAVM